MSLHALAGHMASKGRDTDSMLVHMTPEEVQSLQVLALKGGGTLTINPDTGLPEASFLKKMLPMIAGVALGPAGFGLMSAGMAGAAVGGITALSTGSLSRGLMAGMGAYGGANLGAGLANMGSSAVGADALAAANASADPIMALTAAKDMATATGAAAPTGFSALAEGAKAAFNDPSSFVQSMGGMGKLAQTGLAAISPMMADQGVQTATKRSDTGTIRNFTFDPYGQTYTSAGNYPASEYGGRGMAHGGIVALAAGGVSDAEIQSFMAANQGADDRTIASAMQQYNVTPGQLSSAMGYNPTEVSQRYAAATAPAPSAAAQYAAANNIDINKQIENFARTNPNASDALIDQQMQQYGISNEDVARALGTFGGSKAMEYNVLAGNQGLSGLNQNIQNYLQNNPRATREEAEAAMARVDLNEADVLRATGKSLDELFAPKPIQNVPFTMLPDGVSGGGNTVRNPNGTITTTPNIPGRPEGGFTGMGQVRDAYTQGGGSTGYVNPAPQNMGEFNERFNRQTGDSLAAYDYLMGQGANPVKSGVEQLMRPYSEATMGIPAAEGRPTQKFIFQDGRFVENPNFVPISFNSKGERNVGVSSNEVLKGFDALKPAETQANFDYVSYLQANPDVQSELDRGVANFGNKSDLASAAFNHYTRFGKNDGRPFTMISDAKPEDKAIFEYAEANNVTDAQLAPRMGIPVAEVASRRKKFKDATKPTTTVEPDMSGYGGSAGDIGFGGGGNDGGGVGAPGNDGGAAPGAGQGTAAGVGDMIATGGLVPRRMALGGLGALAAGGSTSQYNLGGYSDGGRLLRGPGDGVSDDIPATIGDKQPARLADGEFVVPARIVSELGNGSTEAGARKLYAMMDRVQKARGKTTGKNRVAANTRADKFLPA